MDIRARSDIARRIGDTAGKVIRPRRLDSALRGAEQDGALRHLVAYLDAVLWRADPVSLRFIFVTPSIEQLLGHPVSEWLGEPEHWVRLVEPEDREGVLECLRAAARDGSDGEVEFRLRAADGSVHWLRHVVRSVSEGSGAPELWGVTTDITADKLAQAALENSRQQNRALSAQAERFRQQALQDPLTGLPNRILFDDRLRQALRAAERNEKTCAALLLDLDRFKDINDTYGHQTGDLVLREVALRLRLALRRADTAGRIGGDEFAAVLPDADANAAIRVARRILDALGSSLEIEGGRLGIGVSIGIAIFPAHGEDAASLLAGADEAMYRAKEAGGGYELYDPGAGPPRAAGPRQPDVRPGHPRRRLLHAAFGLMAALLAVSGTGAFVAFRGEQSPAAAARLDTASVALAEPTTDEAIMGEILDGAEHALARMSLHDLTRPDLLAAIDRLHGTLQKLTNVGPAALRERIQLLIKTLQSAEAAAQIATPSKQPITLNKPTTVPSVPLVVVPVPQAPEAEASPGPVLSKPSGV